MLLPQYSKKKIQHWQKNYKPVHVLHCVTKVFEITIQEQLSEHIDKILSQFLCCFNTQIAMLGLTEKWETSLDEKEHAGAMDLSKAFDTINHE